MADNKESFQESVMIRRAKRRLFGAVIILIILFILSIFFLQDRTNANLKNPIKISFLGTSNGVMVDINTLIPKNIPQAQSINKPNPSNIQAPQAFSSYEKPYFIQVGIFSDETNASRLLGTIKSLGFGARLELIKMSGIERLKLTTTTFNSKKEAQAALSILKRANLPGIIKRK